MGRHVTAIDDDPGLLTLNFAASHLETSRLRRNPSQGMPLSLVKHQIPRRGLDLGNTVTDGSTVRWRESADQDIEAVSGSGQDAADVAVQEAWDYLEGKSTSAEMKTTGDRGTGKVTKSAMTKNPRLASSTEDRRKKALMLDDEIEEKKKWKYLEDDTDDLVGARSNAETKKGTGSIGAGATEGKHMSAEAEVEAWAYLDDDSTDMSNLGLPDFGAFVPRHKRDAKKEGALHNENIRNGDPNALCLAVGLFDYTATDEDELSFKRGDEIMVMSKIVEGEDEDAWWEGYLRQDPKATRGIFPVNRVHQVVVFQGIRYMLTQENEVFTLEQGNEEASFLGTFDRESKILSTEDADAEAKAVDWTEAKIL